MDISASLASSCFMEAWEKVILEYVFFVRIPLTYVNSEFFLNKIIIIII